MDKGHTAGIRPPTFLRCGERAAHVMQAITRGTTLPPQRATQYRKWRAAGDRTPATLVAYADACEAEAHHQLELARAARREARTLHLRST